MTAETIVTPVHFTPEMLDNLKPAARTHTRTYVGELVGLPEIRFVAPIATPEEMAARAHEYCPCGTRHVAHKETALDGFWSVDGVTYDEHGFVTCFTCLEAMGSPWCCTQHAYYVKAYEAQLQWLIGRREARLAILVDAEIAKRALVLTGGA